MLDKSADKEKMLSIVVVGASGDLACRKIFPALFALYYQGHFPENVQILGFARSEMTNEAFREHIGTRLTCRTDGNDSCEEKMKSFLDKCSYLSGQYASEESYQEMHKILAANETDKGENRVFYFAIPPSIFLDVAQALGGSARTQTGWNRFIIEKPFGRDSESSAELSKGLSKVFEENEIYRIDHYLGKELVQNLLVLRFANLIFEPIWNRETIESVEITFKEDIDVEGRGGYFDQYGIIRDVMQNHLLQILSLIAMEQPVSLDAKDIRDEKVKVLKAMSHIERENLVVGQYCAIEDNGKHLNGYTEDKTVPNNSITPTYAAAALSINNRRWDGVPFLLRCGKALDGRKAEIRLRFRPVPGNVFVEKGDRLPSNELVIRVQPDEAIYIRVMNKIPGLGMQLDKSHLDLQYKSSFNTEISDAYERLILDVIRGDESLFIRTDELEEAWRIFTPVLKDLERRGLKPESYDRGTRGPSEADYLAAKYKTKWSE